MIFSFPEGECRGTRAAGDDPEARRPRDVNGSAWPAGSGRGMNGRGAE